VAECPKPVRERVILDRFAVGDYRLQPRHYLPLTELILNVRDATTGTPMRLFIEGHADDTGAVAMNRGLSFRRALEVKHFLLEGIAKVTKDAVKVPVTVRGFGTERPRPRAGRPGNRRVEVLLCAEPGPTPLPTSPGARRPLDLRLPEATRRRLEEKDRQEMERRRLTQPLPPAPSRGSLRDRARAKGRDLLRSLGVPARAIEPILNQAEKGLWRGVDEVLKSQGVGGKTREAATTGLRGIYNVRF